MENFDIKKINGMKMNSNISFQQNDSAQINKNDVDKIANKNVTKPTIELDDFFEFLDPKVVEKIMQTSEESRSRIVKDIHSYEYDINGAQNILNSLG